MSCGVGRRYSLDPALLCLWCRPAGVALIRPLTWEPPYTAGIRGRNWGFTVVASLPSLGLGPRAISGAVLSSTGLHMPLAPHLTEPHLCRGLLGHPVPRALSHGDPPWETPGPPAPAASAALCFRFPPPFMVSSLTPSCSFGLSFSTSPA